MTDPSAACCKGKPIHMYGPEAKLKGEFQEFDGLKTYVVGPPTATSALLVIYDIFGFWTQTLHGMDTLSLTATTSSPAGLKLFAPDWFDGAEADISYWPADTDDKLKYIKGYFATHADPGKTLKRMVSVMEAIRGREEYKGIERWGIAGYCWGGKLFDGVKIVTLASQEGTIFKAGAQTHPSLVEPEDAKLVTIPQIVLPSMDEDPEQMAAYEENLKVEKYFERFGDQVHGWMSSKGDLENPRTREAFYRGYELWGNFFAKHL